MKINKKNYKVVLYEEQYKGELFKLLNLFVKEVFSENYLEPDVDRFVEEHIQGVYLVLCDDRAIAFSSFILCEYYGLRVPTLSNDFIYIDKEFRNGYVIMLLALQVGKYVESTGLNLEHFYADGSESNRFIGRLKKKVSYISYEYDMRDVVTEYYRLQRIMDEKIKVR